MRACLFLVEDHMPRRRIPGSADTDSSQISADDGAVSQFVHEQLAAPDHGGIGADVSAFAQTQHSPNQNSDPQGSAVSQFVQDQLAAPDHGGIGAEVSAFASAVSQFVHEQLAAPDHGGIGAQVSAFAQAHHSTANQAGGTDENETDQHSDQDTVLRPTSHTGPTVTTDASDYAPGSTAEITASGFGVGDDIKFTTQVIDPKTSTVSPVVWDVVDGSAADGDHVANGQVLTQFAVTSAYADTTVELLATDTATGQSATTTFTDAAAKISPTNNAAGFLDQWADGK